MPVVDALVSVPVHRWKFRSRVHIGTTKGSAANALLASQTCSGDRLFDAGLILLPNRNKPLDHRQRNHESAIKTSSVAMRMASSFVPGVPKTVSNGANGPEDARSPEERGRERASGSRFVYGCRAARKSSSTGSARRVKGSDSPKKVLQRGRHRVRSACSSVRHPRGAVEHRSIQPKLRHARSRGSSLRLHRIQCGKRVSVNGKASWDFPPETSTGMADTHR